MRSSKIYKKFSVIIICFMFFSVMCIPADVNAATKGTASALISHAVEHLGDKYNTFNDCKAFSTDWCAMFVEHCSAKSGCSKAIPTSGCGNVNDLAYNIVNKKGGKITFVNKTFYNKKKSNFTGKKSYNSTYAPRKGDLIIFSSDASYWWNHVGIVRKDCSKPRSNVYTIEGNTSGANYWNSKVAYKTRTSTSGFYIVAYVTPKYSSATSTYTIKFDPGASSGVTNMPSTQTITAGKAIYFSNLPTPKRSGYTFAGWKNSSDGKIYKSNVIVKGNRTFTAQWTADSSASKSWVATGTAYSNWLVQKPSASTTTSGTTKKVSTVQSVTAYTSYAYFTDNKQGCWKAKNNGYYPNLLKIYSSVSVKSSGYKKDTDGSYFLPRTVSISSPGKLGTVYRLSYKGYYASSFTAGTNLGYTYVWPTSSNTQTIYRTKTVTYTYQ